MLWLPVFLACRAPAYTCSDAPGTDDVGEAHVLVVASPSDGAVVRSDWVPIRVPLDLTAHTATATMCLDGAPLHDPLLLLRRTREVTDRVGDLLAWLPTEGLAPGTHHLQVAVRRGDGGGVVAESRFELDPRPHAVDLRVTRPGGAPLSARVVVIGPDGPVDLGPPDAEADPEGRDAAISSVFVREGVGRVRLDPGTYRLVAVRSILDELGVAEVVVDGDREVALVVAPAIDAPEWIAADLHVHTGMSYDSFVPDALRFASLEAAGLDVAVLTDHHRVRDPAPAEAWLGDQRTLRVVPGVEADLRAQGPSEGPHWDLGHLNAFPVRGAEGAPMPDYRPSTVGAYLDTWRERQAAAPLPDTGETVLLQLNHPRGIHFRPERPANRGAWPLFSMLGFDPSVPVGEGANAWMTIPEPSTGTIALDFDALEVMNRFSLDLYLEVRRDWFALLDQGYALTGTGNSDSHALEVETAGFPVNLVRAPRPAPGAPLDGPAFLDALSAGRVIATTGPVVELSVGDAGIGDTAAGASPVARVRVRAASWVPVDEVRLVVDGEVVWTEALPEGPLDLTREVPLAVTANAWVIAEAGWPLDGEGRPPQPLLDGDWGAVAAGYVPMAFTNPVWLDVDADGAWRAPGL